MFFNEVVVCFKNHFKNNNKSILLTRIIRPGQQVYLPLTLLLLLLVCGEIKTKVSLDPISRKREDAATLNSGEREKLSPEADRDSVSFFFFLLLKVDLVINSNLPLGGRA